MRSRSTSTTETPNEGPGRHTSPLSSITSYAPAAGRETCSQIPLITLEWGFYPFLMMLVTREQAMARHLSPRQHSSPRQVRRLCGARLEFVATLLVVEDIEGATLTRASLGGLSSGGTVVGGLGGGRLWWRWCPAGGRGRRPTRSGGGRIIVIAGGRGVRRARHVKQGGVEGCLQCCPPTAIRLRPPEARLLACGGATMPDHPRQRGRAGQRPRGDPGRQLAAPALALQQQ
jgi:hypothetical protein